MIKKTNHKLVNLITVALIVLSGVLIFVGVRRGEMMEVFFKARMICLECIGIG